MARIKLSAFLALVLVASLLSPATSSATAPEGSCSASILTLRSLHIEAHPSKKKVRPGEKFTVHFRATRPAHEDPFDQGIEFTPPVSVPAEDVIASLYIWVGRYTYFWQVGITDENGEDTLKVRVPKNSEYGWALATASGRHWIKNDCPDILEDGFTNYGRFVKVVP